MTEVLKLLLDKIDANHQAIENFFQIKFKESPALFYNSVDLRHSGFKIAPVDTNCFPAGFNNLSLSSRANAHKIVNDFLTNNFPQVKKILILPENHTRNLKYLTNVVALSEIIQSNNREVVVGSLIGEIDISLTVDLENDQKITLHKLIKNQQNQISTKEGFIPDVIIANNDFTDGVPELLKNITQAIVPSASFGWYVRKKSIHFTTYNEIVNDFCQIIDIDPWLISTMHRNCNDVDFKQQKGIKCLAKYVDELIAKLKEKYQQYNVTAQPYCYIKADNGTYGMAMMTVQSGAEILEINKKERNKMNMLKGSVQNTQVIIQEGIATADEVKGAIAEPMIYLMNGLVVGNLFRVNDQRDVNISLNAAGMSFADLSDLSDADLSLGLPREQIIKVYSVIARLAALAASSERY